MLVPEAALVAALGMEMELEPATSTCPNPPPPAHHLLVLEEALELERMAVMVPEVALLELLSMAWTC